MSSEQPLISRATLIFTEVSSRIAVTAPLLYNSGSANADAAAAFKRYKTVYKVALVAVHGISAHFW